jgi:uncharacterized protein (TIGR02284 family)
MRNEGLFQEYDSPHRPAAIAALRSVIEVCRDGERGYLCAAEDVGDQWLRQLFWDYASQRATFATVLERELVQLGGRLEPRPTVAGWIHRKWLDIRATIEHGSAIAMLLECERGENAARVMYEHALDVPLPVNLQELLLAQLAEIHDAHDRLDRMRGGSLSVKLTSG